MSESPNQSLFDEFPAISTDEWEVKIKQDLNGADYHEKLRWHTGEGIAPLPFYRQKNLGKLNHVGPVTSDPDYTWEIREPIYGASINEANAAARRALHSGAEALHFSIDINATPDDGNLTFQGVPIQNQSDFSKLLDDLPLDETSVHFDAGPLSPALMAMLGHEITARNVPETKIAGSILIDPISIRLRHGISISLDQFPHITSFAKQYLPDVCPLGIDARLYKHAGGTIVQELGFALASATELLSTLTENNFTVQEAANLLHFNFSIGSKYFLEIAKFRAIRLLWNNLLDAFGGNSKETPAYIHAQTSRWNKTAYEPYANMLRTSTEGMSAVLGNCDALTVLPFDEVNRQPDKFSQRIARNSQIIMREEAYLDKVEDPGAGSYYIEQLTNDLAREAWQLFQKVEEHGGMMRAIEDEFVHSSIETSRQKKDQAIASRRRIFVGTNQYPSTEKRRPEKKKTGEPAFSLKKTDADVDFKPNRWMASLKQAIKDGATLGDISSAIFAGADPEAVLLKPYRGPQAFEELRRATEMNRRTPKVLNLPLGNPKIRKARSTFSNNFFGCAGYEIEDPIGLDNVAEAVDSIQKERPDIAVLCSSDEEYKELAPALCQKLKEIDERPLLVLAGYPKEQIATYQKAGVDLFIHSGCNVLETLTEVHQKLNIMKN